MGYETHCADCMQIMKDIPDGSIDLAILDPPYFRIVDEEWDNQWSNIGDYIDWMGGVFAEVKRVLRPNGSVYCFADDLV